MKQTISVGKNGLKLSIHEDHVVLHSGWRPGVRIDSEDLVHLTGLLTLASANLDELVAPHEVLNNTGSTASNT